jgi:membrane protein DedA with SNARE-associated domain
LGGTPDAVLAWFLNLPDVLVYLLIGLAAALENLIPPIPGDVVVVIGGVIAGAGGANPRSLFVVVWSCNVASALLVYWVGHHYGARFFTGKLGRFLLAPAQVEALSAAYRRFGFPIIFFSRFLPVFRPIVPAFAGVARLGFWGTAIPVAVASAVWYGFLVYVGSIAGENWHNVLDSISRIGNWLWAVAVIAMLLIAAWWWRSRSGDDTPTEQST